VIPAATTEPALVATIGGCWNSLLVLSKNKQDQQPLARLTKKTKQRRTELIKSEMSKSKDL
jgi:hypothetical protein